MPLTEKEVQLHLILQSQSGLSALENLRSSSCITDLGERDFKIMIHRLMESPTPSFYHLGQRFDLSATRIQQILTPLYQKIIDRVVLFERLKETPK